MKHSKIILAASAAMFLVNLVQAQATGILITRDNRRLEGTFRWLSSTKEYAINLKEGTTLQMPLALIADYRIVKPAGLDAAVQQVQSGNTATAIGVLEKIVSDYTNLQWDRVAMPALVDAYLKAGDAKKAIATCERAIEANPEAAYRGEIAVSYWRALLKDNKQSKLNEILGKAVASGDQLSSAYALILRGDMVLAQGESRDHQTNALKNGYLRVVMLYKDVKEAQPEALYKAMKCFQALGQNKYADDMRMQLKGQYSTSEWAKKG